VLFPDWSSRESKLVGIAKLASESTELEAKRRVTYRELPTRSFFGICTTERMPFKWMINPYRGCEFGCKYCYARYTHEFMELRDPRQFEELIFAKSWNETEFRRQLRKAPLAEPIAIGTATDPYQPAERRYGLTRKMLKAIAAERGRTVWITTKSDLFARDLDVMREIESRGGHVSINLTVTTMDEQLARLVEPFAPRPALRMAALKKITDAGILGGVLCSPLMPLINDSENSLSMVAEAAAAAGASWMHGNVVFLKPCAKTVFFEFVDEHFPKLSRRYRERFDRAAYLKGEYVDMVGERVRKVRESYGLTYRAAHYRAEDLDGQLNLF